MLPGNADTANTGERLRSQGQSCRRCPSKDGVTWQRAGTALGSHRLPVV